MKFKLNENINNKYEGWTQEDIELYEAIDWDEVGETDYDAGFAYLDSAILYDTEGIIRVKTEFHKFFKKDPYSSPYYMPIEPRPFETNLDYSDPSWSGKIHKGCEVHDQFGEIKK